MNSELSNRVSQSDTVAMPVVNNSEAEKYIKI